MPRLGLSQKEAPALSTSVVSGKNPDPTRDYMCQLVQELRGLARRALQSEHRPLLQPTEIVNEAYLKLLERQEKHSWCRGRTHFFAVASSAIRQVLVDQAREARTQKRGQGLRTVTFHDFGLTSALSSVDVLILDETLHKLAALSPDQHKMVELRFFAGLTQEEIARVLNVSPTTVKNMWRSTKAWLIKEFKGSAGE